jgi:hypothetical protein
MLTSFKEWNEMREMRHKFKEFEEKKEERHMKRMERQKRIQGGAGGSESDAGGESDAVARTPQYYGSAPDLTYGGRYQTPYYADGNPYASGGLPAPPVGYTHQPRR